VFDDKKIIIFAAHPDDIEIGMGGTLNQLKKHKPKIIVFADTVLYNGPTIREEFYESMKNFDATLMTFRVDDLQSNMVPIRELIWSKKDDCDIVFSTSKRSTHQDHRVIGQAVNDIMLEKTVFFFEDIRSGQNQYMNCYNPISSDDLTAKYRMIDCYKTQKKRHYTTEDAIATMARFRGGQIKTN